MGMKSRKRISKSFTCYILEAEYITSKHDWGSIDKALEKAVGRHSDSSGISLSEDPQRDLAWFFDRRQGAFRAAKRIQKLGLKHLKITLFNYKIKHLVVFAAKPS